MIYLKILLVFFYLFVGSSPNFVVAILFGDHNWEFLKYYILLGSMWYHFIACLVG
jgi:hypothetical protein